MSEFSAMTFPSSPFFSRGGRRAAPWLFAAATVALTVFRYAGILTSSAASPAQKPISAPQGKHGVEIVQVGGYPELQVDGKPFFVHSAAFFYYRIPRDLWEESLARYRELGVNTIDIYIPWNWHEPEENKLDFDGHTNARRDLRALLKLIAADGFRLIARPGPQILNEWRNGGYPVWLLERPEYKMGLADRLEGCYPSLAGLNARDAEGGAQSWLDNPTHLEYAKKWLGAVAHELAPYTAARTLEVATPPGPDGEAKEIGGPLLFVQLEDSMAVGRMNYVGPAFWKYMALLRSMLEEGGLNVPVFINPPDMRVSAAGFALDRPIAAMGQWFMQPRIAAETQNRFADEDASTIEFLTEELKTQPGFPPMLIEYQAGWHAPGDDDRPTESPADNTLLSSRLLLGNGIRGFSYFPLQDTVAPPGYSAPWANRSYRWDAALSPDAENQARAQAVRRNADVVRQWGPFLAAAHKRPDFGILYPLSAFPQAELAGEDIQRVSDSVLRLERLGQLAHLSSEALDPQYQPVEQLLRDPLLVLPVFDPREERFHLSLRAQQTLVAYVKRGGILAAFPERPLGAAFDEIWNGVEAAEELPGAGKAREWKFGDGRVLLIERNFLEWVNLHQTFSENRAREESAAALATLRGLLRVSGLRSVLTFPEGYDGTEELVIHELVADENTGLLGMRTGGPGLLSVANLSQEMAVEKQVRVLAPGASARGSGDDYLPLRLELSPRQALLLPLNSLLCSPVGRDEGCEDSVVSAGAEFLGAQRDNRTLQLFFYTPGRAEVQLRLESIPGSVDVEDIRAEGRWDTRQKTFTVTLPRGASPRFLRELKLRLPYVPHVLEKAAKKRPSFQDLEIKIANRVRLPLGEDSSLRSYPPLIPLAADRHAEVLLQAANADPDHEHGLDISIEGALRGSGVFRVPAGQPGVTRIRLKPPGEATAQSANLAPDEKGLLHATMEVREGRDRRTIPLIFLPSPGDSTEKYRFDFDRDGADEWVLENSSFRLIVSPESGGRALALVDKDTDLNLTTTVGAFGDAFAYPLNPTEIPQPCPRSPYGLFNRPYKAKWEGDANVPVLRLSYDAPDVFPSGAHIEKTIRFDGNDALQADYRVSLNAASPPQEGNAAAVPPEQAFIAMNSFPALARGDRKTRFCWNAPSGSSGPAGAVGAEVPPTQLECRDFVPEGSVLSVPGSAARLEIQTSGRPTLALEWKQGKMTIEPKNFSALLRLQFPPLASGVAAASYSLRLNILPAEP